MRIGSGAQRRALAGRVRRVHRAAALAMMTSLLLVAAFGCGAQRGERSSASKPSGGEAKPTARAPAQETKGTKATARTNHVRLTDKSCVDFDPHWTTIQVGQSLTWQSDFKGPVTIHVAPGAFDRNEFVVRTGGSVSTGPARRPGSYAIWTEPTACRGIPRGTEGPAPGLTVEGR